MAKQPGDEMDDFRRRDATLLTQIGEQRDDLHHLTAEVVENVTTLDRHLEVAERLCGLSQQLGSRAHRLVIPAGSVGAAKPDDRKLLAELAALNSDVVPLDMSIMDGTGTAEEQHIFARRLIAMAAQLQARVTDPWVIDGDVTTTTDNGENCTAAHQEP